MVGAFLEGRVRDPSMVDEVVHFFLTSETLVLILRDCLVVNILKELFYILQVVLAGVVYVDEGVEVGDASLGI